MNHRRWSREQYFGLNGDSHNARLLNPIDLFQGIQAIQTAHCLQCGRHYVLGAEFRRNLVKLRRLRRIALKVHVAHGVTQALKGFGNIGSLTHHADKKAISLPVLLGYALHVLNANCLKSLEVAVVVVRRQVVQQGVAGHACHGFGALE